MEGYAVRPLTLRSIEGHDVLLDAAHDLLNSIVESSGQYNRNLMGHTLRSVWREKSIFFFKMGKTVICRYSTG